MNTGNFKNRLFGRTRGRSKKKIDIQDYYKNINKFKITKLDTKKKYILDIGTGYGETTIYLANKYPDLIIIACDKYIDGNLNLIKSIKNNSIKNIYIHPGNVNEILDNNLKKQFFEKIWIFFPDPWPKKRHFKRRLITNQFLIKIYPFLKKNGEILIATDSSSYTHFILKALYDSKKYYDWINQNSVHLSPKDYFSLETKFYKKAIISGRKPSLFILKKI